MTLIAVIAVTAAVILLFTRGDSGKQSPSGIASANDKGPVAVITEDPSCAAWTPIQNTISASEQNGWDQRDWKIPATAWTAGQRAQYEAVGQAMRSAADQTVAVAKLTPHRVMRELYEQSIAYWRAYADRIPSYTKSDEYFAGTVVGTSSALGAICAAITYGSAAARGPLVPAARPPTRVVPPGDPANPQRFLTSRNPVCGEVHAAGSQFDANPTVIAWKKIDPNIPATQWTPEQKQANDAVAPVMSGYADKVEQIGRRSANPILEDFTVLAAQYRRAVVLALPTYTVADNWLDTAASNTVAGVDGACAAAVKG